MGVYFFRYFSGHDEYAYDVFIHTHRDAHTDEHVHAHTHTFFSSKFDSKLCKTPFVKSNDFYVQTESMKSIFFLFLFIGY